MLRAILLSLGLAFAAGPALAQQAEAGPAILVVKMERLLTDSAAARSIARQIDELRADLREQTRAADETIRDAERDLALQRPDLEPETFRARVEAFEADVAEARRAAQARAARLQTAQGMAVERLRAALTPILVDMMRERGALVMLDESQVLLSASRLDVTAEVMARLDAAARAVPVILPDAPTEAMEPETDP